MSPGELGGPYGMLGSKLRSATDKANAQPTVYLFGPQNIALKR